jgi:hypothetical protein
VPPFTSVSGLFRVRLCAVIPLVKVAAPLPSKESAAEVEVAKVEGDEVAKYKVPFAFLNDQWFEVMLAGYERVICGPVEEAIWSAHFGVEVPSPSRSPPAKVTASASSVVVAHLDGAVFVMVTAPVAPETEMPEPATFEVTPVLVTLPAA